MPAIIFLSCEVVIAINKHQVLSFGGLHRIRDRGLLESALARPQTILSGELMYPSPHSMAAVYSHGIIKNHPFVDGNKRTGIATALTFLDLNGYECSLSNNDLVDIGVALATTELSHEEFAVILKLKTSLK
jgi:death on curing protein